MPKIDDDQSYVGHLSDLEADLLEALVLEMPPLSVPAMARIRHLNDWYESVRAEAVKAAEAARVAHAREVITHNHFVGARAIRDRLMAEILEERRESRLADEARAVADLAMPDA